MVDEDLVEDYKDQLTEGDEKKIAKAEKAMLDSRKDDIEAIYARLDAGEDFITVMNEVTEDPALDEWVQENGYYVHPQNTIWPDNFAAASFSEELKEIGDYASQPVVSKNGIHIVMYAGDIPGGGPELTDDIREGIVDYITNEERTEVIESWADEYEVTYNQEVLDKLIAERKAAYEEYEASLAG
jgi:parvulin-like peptidyl-prolyl isomerase